MLSLLLPLLALCGQDAEYRISLSARWSEDGSVTLSGETDLPDSTRIVLTLASGTVSRASFPLANTVVRASGGRFETTLKVFEGAPPPGSYVVRARFAAVFQDKIPAIEAIRSSGKRQELETSALVWVGTPQDLEAFRRERLANLAADVNALLRMGRELITAYEQVLAGRRTANEFERESESIRLKAVEVEKRNLNRLDLRHLSLTAIAEVDIESLRRVVWTIVYRLRETEGESAEERELRLASGKEALRTLEERAGTTLEKLGMPAEPTVALHSALAKLRQLAGEIRNLSEELRETRSRAGLMARTHGENLQRLILELGHLLPRSSYELLQQVSAGAAEACDALLRAAERTERAALDDLDRGVQRLLEALKKLEASLS
jgi:hypothetical protein